MMIELWREMADRFMAVDSERTFYAACKLGGLGLREMLERGTLEDETSRQLLEPSYGGNPRLAEFALTATWHAFADRELRGACVLELHSVGEGNYDGASDFARDWPVVKENYASVCRKRARQPSGPMFATAEELRYRFVNHKGETISKRRLLELLDDGLASDEMRQVANDARGTRQFKIDAAVRLMAKTAWKYRAEN